MEEKILNSLLKERLESRRIVKDSLSIFINKVSAYWRAEYE